MDEVAPPTFRVQRAFAFVDICGFTQIVDRSGDDVGMRILGRSRAHIRDTCGRFGVRVDKWLGDGAMLVGVVPAQLVCAAATIVHHADPGVPPVRGGVTFGDVLVFEGADYIGKPVNLAARLCDLAQPGQLLAEAWTGLSAPRSLVVSDREPVAVRGFRAPVEVCMVDLAPDGADEAPRPHLSALDPR